MRSTVQSLVFWRLAVAAMWFMLSSEDFKLVQMRPGLRGGFFSTDVVISITDGGLRGF